MKTAGLLFLILYSFFAQGQQYHNWVFGFGNTVEFKASKPSASTGTLIKSIEGTASISNEKGKLLFYTNGETIYNRNNQVMQNGDDLLGHESSFQSAVIIPQPGNDSIFYVFTSDAIENDFKNGYNYSVVNIKKNGGLGAVVEKNISLTSTSSERLTAARHANGIDYWIIGNENNSNQFYAWKLTCTGLNPPVVSTVGEILNTHVRMNLGALKVSPNGSMLCQTHFPKVGATAPINFFQLFNFDNNTGMITQPRTITIPSMSVYNAEFSPNSALLYLVNPLERQLGQVNVKGNAVIDIINSYQSIPAAFSFYGIQLAPNGKIYLANYTQYLSAINRPDDVGTSSSFELNALQLPNTSGIGLPIVINDLAPDKNSFNYQIIDSCAGRIQFAGLTSNTGQTDWEWDFGDGNHSTEQNPQHLFADADSAYTVTVKITPAGSCGYILKSKNVLPGGYLAKAGFNFKAQCDSGYVAFENTSVFSDSVQFKWTFGDGATSTDKHPVHQYQGAGNYTVRLDVITPSLCVGSSEVRTVYLERPNVAVTSSKIEVTETETIQLLAKGNFTNVIWEPEVTIASPRSAKTLATPQQDITYYATASNPDGCVGVDSVRIKVAPLTDVFVPSAFTPNGDGKNDVFKPAIGSRFNLRRFSIYNRWGELIFQTKEKGAAWDGSYQGVIQASGTYVWVLEVSAQGKQPIHKKGSVSLLR